MNYKLVVLTVTVEIESEKEVSHDVARYLAEKMLKNANHMEHGNDWVFVKVAEVN